MSDPQTPSRPKNKKFFHKKKKNKPSSLNHGMPDIDSEFLDDEPKLSDFMGPLQPSLVPRLSDEYIKRCERYNADKPLLDELIGHIKTKTAKNHNLIKSLLEQYKNKHKNYNFVSPSGTNLLGFCILYDDCETIEHLNSLASSQEIDYPCIMESNNFYTVFSKSVETNKALVDYLSKKPEFEQKLKLQLSSYAADILYRQENINFYTNWLLAHNFDNDWSKIFISSCIKSNNRPILEHLCLQSKFKPIIAKELNEKNSEYPQILEWLNHCYNRSIKNISLSKPKIIQENQEDLSDASLPNAHLSSAHDNFKMLKNENSEEKKPIQVIKKKRLLSM